MEGGERSVVENVPLFCVEYWRERRVAGADYSYGAMVQCGGRGSVSCQVAFFT